MVWLLVKSALIPIWRNQQEIESKSDESLCDIIERADYRSPKCLYECKATWSMISQLSAKPLIAFLGIEQLKNIYLKPLYPYVKHEIYKLWNCNPSPNRNSGVLPGTDRNPLFMTSFGTNKGTWKFFLVSESSLSLPFSISEVERPWNIVLYPLRFCFGIPYISINPVDCTSSIGKVTLIRGL